MAVFDIDLEKEALFEKRFSCPNCNMEVKAKTVKTGKAKLASTEEDLRPRYEGIDPLKYDGILCDSCGYASVRRFFSEPLVPVQQKHISEKITHAFRPIEKDFEIYTYEEAIRRHKLAYISCIAKNSEISERAYTCLKTAWLYRGYQEYLVDSGNTDELLLEELKSLEDKYSRSAYLDFKEAYLTEESPTCGMDEPTFFYLIGYLAYKEKDYKDSSRWLSQLLSERELSDRLRERAQDLRQFIKEATQE